MRRVASALLGLVAVAGIGVGSVGLWAHAAVFDSSEFTEAANRTFADPQVQAGLTEFITDQTISLIDLDRLVADAVPDRLGSLTPMITGGLEAKLNSQVGAMLATERAARTVDRAVSEAHIAAMRVLSGGSLVGGVSVQDSEVTLNLLPLISGALIGAQDLGVLERLEIPRFDRGGDPGKQIAELSRVLGVQLPDDFGQLVVYWGDRVSSAAAGVAFAQRLVVMATQATWLVVIVTLAAAAGALVLAQSWSQAALYLSLGVAVVVAVLRSGVAVVIEQSGLLVGNPSARVAVESALGNFTEGLVDLFGLMILAAAAVALVSLMILRFGSRPLVATIVAVAVVVAVGSVGVSAVSLVAGVAVGLLAGLAITAFSRSDSQARSGDP